uniref:Uncharacterized protein n=1 Tax=Knipowitschia caucasica TaxID=637954 RepID=A0AAV2L3N0_KNICA
MLLAWDWHNDQRERGSVRGADAHIRSPPLTSLRYHMNERGPTGAAATVRCSRTQPQTQTPQDRPDTRGPGHSGASGDISLCGLFTSFLAASPSACLGLQQP